MKNKKKLEKVITKINKSRDNQRQYQTMEDGFHGNPLDSIDYSEKEDFINPYKSSNEFSLNHELQKKIVNKQSQF